MSGTEQKNAGFSIKDLGGAPALFHGDAPFPAAAYMTYLEKYTRFADFAEAGYRLFSFPALFAGRWISVTDGFRPFGRGIYDDIHAPDFSGFDASVRRILAVCPEAYLIPRVNVSAPIAWLKAHPACTDGTGKRESLFSEEWLPAAESMLRGLIRHVKKSDYRSRIAGYHIAGGNTEEWFHFDMNGGASPAAEPGFRAFLSCRSPEMPYAGLPDLRLLNGPGPLHGSPYLERYLEYANEAVAQAVVRLARAAKDEAGAGVVIGAFYGYALEVSSPLYGTHALKTLLESDAVDYICSPNSYIGVRAPDADWTEMYAADSVRLHGKLCVQECDVRTHLTKPLCERAPEYDPNGILNAPIWQGLPDREQAVRQMRKSFCRQLIRGNGFWWFDMWDGWYNDETLMAELARFRRIYTESLTKPDRGSAAEIAVFVDETAFRRMTACGRRNTVFEQRGPLGIMGAPYDTFDVYDFKTVFRGYKAAIFTSGIGTEAVEEAEALCRANGIPYLSNSDRDTLFSAEELRAFCEKSGAHVYCGDGDVIYVNRHYFAIHAVQDGEKTLTFKEHTTLRDLFDGEGTLSGTRIKLRLRRGETLLFERK